LHLNFANWEKVGKETLEKLGQVLDQNSANKIEKLEINLANWTYNKKQKK
jgi:hypothetical protein